MADFAGLRHVMEFPQLLAGNGIKGTRIGIATAGDLPGVGADYHYIAVDGRYCRTTDLKDHYTLFTETGGRLACGGVQSIKVICGRVPLRICRAGEDNPGRVRIVPRPVSDAAVGLRQLV